HTQNAKATANIQFAVSLLSESLRDILENSFNIKDRLDFNKSLEMLGDKVKEIFPNLESQKQRQLEQYLQRAKAITSRLSTQNFDFDRCEHDLECLLRLATLLGFSECHKQIINFSGVIIEDWEKLKAEGNDFYKNRKWTEAMNCYSRAIKSTSNVAVLFSNRALCEINLRKFDLAREDAEDAIELDPSPVKFYRILSETLFKLRLYQQAADVCKAGLKISSTDETLLMRVRLCDELVLDSEQQSNADRSKVGQDPTVHKKLRDCQVESTSDISPDEVHPMDSAVLQSISELDKAHQILQSGRGDIGEEQKAFEIFESVAKQGSAQGLYNMAIMYKDGNAGLARDPAKHFQLCLQAAEQNPYLSAMDDVFLNIGVAEAENALGVAYRDGMAVDKDDKLAFKWFLKSARHGYASAMSNLGLAFYNGTGCERSPTSARWWLQKAADLGQSEAQLKLAGMLIEGEGGPADSEKAVELLKAAANQGLPGALEALQQQMRRGATKAKRMNSTRKIVEEKAAANDKEALFLLGMNYLQGEGGFEQDFELAESYLRKAFDRNHEKAAFVLGNLFLRLRRNKDSVYFLRHAAENGNEEAQWTLGFLLSIGHGCDRDAAEARIWMLRSKKQSKKCIDDLIEQSSQFVRVEAARGLSTKDGLSQLERIERLCIASLSNSMARDATKEVFELLRQETECELHPGTSSWCEMVNMLTTEKLMAKRVAEGSKTAQLYFIAHDLLDQMRWALKSKNPEAFRLYRLAARAWQPLMFDMDTWDELLAAATEAFEKNPRDADAYFAICQCHACKNMSNNKELVRMALTCTNLNPNVADYYVFLCNMYAFVEDGVGSLKAVERALELEWEPTWLLEKAKALVQKYINRQDRSIIIEAYKEFIAANEKDQRHIPEANYYLSYEYMEMKDEEMAREYYQRGLRAESPEVRLPCFEPVQDYRPKEIVEAMFKILDSSRSNPGMSFPFPNGESSGGAWCGSCGMPDASRRCSRCKKSTTATETASWSTGSGTRSTAPLED
ncbi:hypothetical protein BOX15_Mlig011296g1, partial [Macrostomum lignano]